MSLHICFILFSYYFLTSSVIIVAWNWQSFQFLRSIVQKTAVLLFSRIIPSELCSDNFSCHSIVKYCTVYLIRLPWKCINNQDNSLYLWNDYLLQGNCQLHQLWKGNISWILDVNRKPIQNMVTCEMCTTYVALLHQTLSSHIHSLHQTSFQSLYN